MTKIEAHENPAITMNIQNIFSVTEPTTMEIINYQAQHILSYFVPAEIQ